MAFCSSSSVVCFRNCLSSVSRAIVYIVYEIKNINEKLLLVQNHIKYALLKEETKTTIF